MVRESSSPIHHSQLCQKPPKVDGQAFSAVTPHQLSTPHLSSTLNVNGQEQVSGKKGVLVRVKTRPSLGQSMTIVPMVSCEDKHLAFGHRISVTTTVQVGIAFGSLLRRHGAMTVLYSAGEIFKWRCLS